MSKSDDFSEASLDALLTMIEEGQSVELFKAEIHRRMNRRKTQVAFYKQRCTALQQMQPYMRDPERKWVCDILANGKTSYVPDTPMIQGREYSGPEDRDDLANRHINQKKG